MKEQIEEYKLKRLLGLIENAFIMNGKFFIYLYGTECKVVKNPTFHLYQTKDSIGYVYQGIERKMINTIDRTSYFQDSYFENSFDYVNVHLASYTHMFYEGLIDDLINRGIQT